MQNTEKADATVESVDRALRLLGMLYAGELLSVTVAADRLGVAPSTAHRLLSALRQRGYAVQDRARMYRVGPALGTSAPDRFSFAALQRAARPGMVAAQERIGETMHLMTLQGSQVYFIDGIESPRPLRVAVRTGARMPAFCSAGGKAMLAVLSAPQVEELHATGLPDWPTGKIGSMGVLERQLGEVRRLGYGVNVEETEAGVCGVGVSVTIGPNTPVAAVAFAVPAARFANCPIESYAEPLIECAAAMRERLLEEPH